MKVVLRDFIRGPVVKNPPCMAESLCCSAEITTTLLPTHPRLIDGVVELGLHGDLAVGVGIHQRQAEVGVVAAPGERRSRGQK